MAILRPLPAHAAPLEPLARLVSAEGEPDAVVNVGFARRFPAGSLAHDSRHGGRLSLALFDVVPRHLPFPLVYMERHPLTAQVITPVQASGWIVLVAPDAADGGPDMRRAVAAWLGPAQGVVYAPGAWHHPIIVTDGPALFLVQSWQTGTAALDLEERAVEGVELAAPG